MPVEFWLYLLVAIPYSLFVVLYSTRSPWYATAMGRSLLLSKTVIALLSIHVCLILAFGDYPGSAVVRALVVGGAILAGWTQLFLLIREQRAPRPRA